MAISLPGFTPISPPSNPTTQPSTFTPPLDRARAETALREVPQNPAPGSLVIVDSFQDGYNASHGNVAAYAARQHGFRGEIFAERIGPEVPTSRESEASRDQLRSGPQEPAETRQIIQDITRHSQRQLLEDVTADLDKIRERGLQDSAVNVSYGTHPQSEAQFLYSQVVNAPRERPSEGTGILASMADSVTTPGGIDGDYNFAQNVFNAYGIDQGKFFNSDPNVSGPETLRLQQSLLEAAEAGGNAPDVQAAKATYGDAVSAIEAHNNSVVVSAGNQGGLLDHFALSANGERVQASPNSGHNVLVNSEVTTVGATRWYDSGTERIASYNSQHPETDMYASGSVGNGQDQNQANVLGTSFASPRVAGAMAALHGNHPGMPSANIENLVRNRLSHELSGERVLDFSIAEEYMRRGTF